MHLMTLASAVVLAPALALLLGMVIVGGIAWRKPVDDGARWVALVATAVALGTAVGLWLASRSGALDVLVVSRSGSAGATFGVHLDALAGACLVTLLVTGLAVIGQRAPARSVAETALTLLALFLAAGLVLASSLAMVTVLWTMIVFLAAVDLIASKTVESAIPLVALGLCGAPALVIGGAALSSVSDGAPLAIAAPVGVDQWAALAVALVGAVSAGLTPLNGWLERRTDSDLLALIVDAVLPLAGFYLAARAIQLDGADRSIVLIVVLVGFGLWGVGDAAHAAFTAADLETASRAAGRGESGLAFVALAVGTAPAVAAALFLMAFSVLARQSVRVAGRDAPARLGWASVVGLPPLPGFVGRWLIVSAALAAGAWLLGIAIGLAALLLALGSFGSASYPCREERPLSTVALAPLALIVIAGLAPARWLVAALFPISSLPGTASHPVAATASLAALVIALLPALVAATFARHRDARRHADVSRTIQERAWDGIERFAEQAASLWRIVEGRYNLAVGLLVVVVAVFAFVR